MGSDIPLSAVQSIVEVSLLESIKRSDRNNNAVPNFYDPLVIDRMAKEEGTVWNESVTSTFDVTGSHFSTRSPPKCKYFCRRERIIKNVKYVRINKLASVMSDV